MRNRFSDPFANPTDPAMAAHRTSMSVNFHFRVENPWFRVGNKDKVEFRSFLLGLSRSKGLLPTC